MFRLYCTSDFLTVTNTPTQRLHQSTASIDTGHESREFPVPRGGTVKTSAILSSVQAETRTGYLSKTSL
jgi:hypothetical protein